MNLLSRLGRALAVRRRERATIRELSWLSDRDLADLNLSRGDIPDVAWLAARTDGFDVFGCDDLRAARTARSDPDRRPESLAAAAATFAALQVAGSRPA